MERPLDYLEWARRACVSAGWLLLMYPLVQALVALVMAWTSAASDPLAGVR